MTNSGSTVPAATMRTALVAMAALAIFINYVDRGNLATAAPLIKSELHLSNVQIGLLTSAFFWTYTPGQLFAGWIAERLGGYRALALGFLVWSGATALTGLAGGFVALIALRVLLGIGESVGFPCVSKLFADTLPPVRLGLANGFITAGLAFGPAFGVFFGGLIVASFGWRAMFVAFGCVALLWLVPWFAVSKKASARSHLTRTQPPRYAALLSQRGLWGVCLGHFAANYWLYFVLSWLPLWLVRERGFSLVAMAELGAAVYCVQGISAIAFGWFSDRLIARGLSATLVRKTLVIFGHLGGALALIGCVSASRNVVITCLLISGFCGGAIGPSLWSIAQTLAGPRAAARWVGVQNGIGNLAGIIGPVITGWIVDRTGSFGGAFLLTAAITMIGAVGWGVILRRVEPIAWDTTPDESAGGLAITLAEPAIAAEAPASP
jgi:MFS family permease